MKRAELVDEFFKLVKSFKGNMDDDFETLENIEKLTESLSGEDKELFRYEIKKRLKKDKGTK